MLHKMLCMRPKHNAKAAGLQNVRAMPVASKLQVSLSLKYGCYSREAHLSFSFWGTQSYCSFSPSNWRSSSCISNLQGPRSDLVFLNNP